MAGSHKSSLLDKFDPPKGAVPALEPIAPKDLENPEHEVKEPKACSLPSSSASGPLASSFALASN